MRPADPLGDCDRRPWLDVVRAAAVLLVLGRHMPAPSGGSALAAAAGVWQAGGWVGVDLFFVLSGYLVAGVLFREHARTWRLDAGRFYARRALRLYPPFLVFVAFSAIAFAGAGRLPINRLAAELLWGQSYVPGLWGHTWSLAVEEHFYLLLPIVLAAVRRAGRVAGGDGDGGDRMRGRAADPFRRLPWLVVGAAILSLALRVATAAAGPFSDLTHLFPTHLRLDGLFLGVLLAHAHHCRRSSFEAVCRRWRPALLIGGAVLLAPAFVLPLRHPVVHTVGLTAFALGAGAWIAAAATAGGGAGPVAGAAGRLGRHSYSIYLWHAAVPAFLPALFDPSPAGWPWAARAAGFIAASVGVGVATGLAVERPALRLRHRLCPPRNERDRPALRLGGPARRASFDAADAATGLGRAA
ncbi:MAG: acyltransferase 3 [Phycisphaerales bacterium]|nr:acyltransferase 3 [Phycisphaerales bacterium]